MSDVIKSYLAKIDREFKTGRATEHTHRPALKDLIESLDSGVSATNEPKRVECGAPDFILRRDGLSIGYVETKDLGKSLDEAEDSDQLQRYKKSLPNLILTDYLEFRWFVDGQLRDSARLGRIGKGNKILPDKKGIDETTQLLKLFLESRPHQQDATSRAFPRRSGSFMWAATRSARIGSGSPGQAALLRRSHALSEGRRGPGGDGAADGRGLTRPYAGWPIE